MLVDIESLHLVEDAVGSGADGLVAEDASRGDDADGRLLSFHHTHLDGRGVRTQGDILFAFLLLDEESVLHVAGGMVRREVECREEMPVVFDFHRLCHGKAQTGEDFGNLVHHHREDVSAAELSEVGGQREVVRVVQLLALFAIRLELLNLVHRYHLQLVESLAEVFLLLVGDRFKLFEKVTDDTLLT